MLRSGPAEPGRVSKHARRRRSTRAPCVTRPTNGFRKPAGLA